MCVFDKTFLLSVQVSLHQPNNFRCLAGDTMVDQRYGASGTHLRKVAQCCQEVQLLFACARTTVVFLTSTNDGEGTGSMISVSLTAF